MLDKKEISNRMGNGKDFKNYNNPKVLILSHNPLSKDQSNGKTIYSMLRNIPKENLAQLYLTTDIPDFDLCNNYFEINDFDILRKLVCRKEFGKTIKVEDIGKKVALKEKIHDSVILNIIRETKGPLFNILRDLFWMLAGYRERRLRKFIRDFNPDVLFFQSSGNVFSFRIAEWIINAYNVNVIVETTDDYLEIKPTIDPIFYILNYRLNVEYRMITKKAKMVIVISDEMKSTYSKKYPCNYYVAMNSVDIQKWSNDEERKLNNSIKILFSGNIGLNRWKTILLLSKIIEGISSVDIELNIYTLSNLSRYVKNKFGKMKKTKFKKAVDSERLVNIQKDSDIMLHVESFDLESRYITKYSISTKISEYLASGKAILAIGPSDVASIKYLKREGAAEVVTHLDKKEIENAIMRLFSVEYRKKLGQRGMLLARNKHNIEKVANDVENTIKDASSQYYSC